MQAFSFQTVAHIVLEAGIAKRLGQALRERHAGRRACVVTDAFLHRGGTRRLRLRASARRAGKCW